MMCPACLSANVSIRISDPKDFEYFTERKCDGKILACDDCDSLFQSPWPSKEETNTFYPEDYQNYSKSSVPFLSWLVTKQNQMVAKKISKDLGADSTLLDFGCGDGTLLQSLYHAGMKKVYGYEPHYRVGEVSKDEANHFKIVNNLDLLDGTRFNFIRMNHVIEHLSELDSTMIALREKLLDGGSIIGQTPNASSFTAKFFGKTWGALHYPYHTIIFSQRGLALAAGRWGFELVKVSGSTMPTGWAMTMENMIKSLFKIKSRGRTPLYSLLLLFSIPFVLLDRLIKANNVAVFDFVLKKK